MVQSLHTCLKTDITFDELNDVNFNLHKFVRDANELYPLTSMTYNVHQMIHIPKCVNDWGPLWAHSAFSFESANHKLIIAIKLSRGVIIQILRIMNIQHYVKTLEQTIYPNCSDIPNFFKDSLISKAKKVFKLTEIKYIGKSKSIEPFLIETCDVSESTRLYKKMIYKGCLYQTSAKNNPRSCNYYAQLKNDGFIKINHFLVDAERNKEITVYNRLITRNNKYVNFIQNVVKISDENSVEPTAEIKTICIFMKIENIMYIIPAPNLFKY